MSNNDTDAIDSDGNPWRDEDVLRELYWGDGLSYSEIADELSCGPSTVQSWMDKHGISRRSHGGKDRRAKYKDEVWVSEQYHDEKRSIRAMADECGIEESTLRYWMDKFDIEKDDPNERRSMHGRIERSYLYTNESGYVVAGSSYGDSSDEFVIHRLLAVAEYGFDELRDKDVHHKIPIPWLNTPDNIEPISHGEHIELHHQQGDFDENLERIHEQLREDPWIGGRMHMDD